MWLLRLRFVSRALNPPPPGNPSTKGAMKFMICLRLAILSEYSTVRYVHTCQSGLVWSGLQYCEREVRTRFLYLFCSHDGDLETRRLLLYSTLNSTYV